MKSNQSGQPEQSLTSKSSSASFQLSSLSENDPQKQKLQKSEFTKNLLSYSLMMTSHKNREIYFQMLNNQKNELQNQTAAHLDEEQNQKKQVVLEENQISPIVKNRKQSFLRSNTYPVRDDVILQDSKLNVPQKLQSYENVETRNEVLNLPYSQLSIPIKRQRLGSSQLHSRSNSNKFWSKDMGHIQDNQDIELVGRLLEKQNKKTILTSIEFLDDQRMTPVQTPMHSNNLQEHQQAGAFVSSLNNSRQENAVNINNEITSHDNSKADQTSKRIASSEIQTNINQEIDITEEALNSSLKSQISFLDMNEDLTELGISQKHSKKARFHNLKRETCLLYPDNSYKNKWDIWLVFILLFVAITLPYRIAFIEKDSTTWQVINQVINASFGIDIALTFITARQETDSSALIIDKKILALMYIKSWFFIDIISIIPFDQIFANQTAKLTKFAKFSAFSRFTRLTRLFRILRMAKMFRLCRDRKRMQQGVGSVFKLSANMERILIFLVVIGFINHTLTCLWVMAAKIDDTANWISAYRVRQATMNMKEFSTDFETYMISFYFVATTITTVGYGDITAVNGIERLFNIGMLFIGVMTFSFASGSLSSIITNYDNAQSGMNQKLEKLNKIKEQYNLPPVLFAELQASIKFEYSKSVDGLGEFMISLPLRLRHQMAQEIYKNVAETFPFLKSIKEKSFLSWIGHRLVPRMINEKAFLYQETEELSGMFFIKDGCVAFIMPRYENAIYKRIESGQIIGFEDYAYHLNYNLKRFEENENNELSWQNIQRKFTAISTIDSHALELPIQEVFKIKKEFPSVASMMYDEAEKAMTVLLSRRMTVKKKLEALVSISLEDSMSVYSSYQSSSESSSSNEDYIQDIKQPSENFSQKIEEQIKPTTLLTEEINTGENTDRSLLPRAQLGSVQRKKLSNKKVKKPFLKTFLSLFKPKTKKEVKTQEETSTFVEKKLVNLKRNTVSPMQVDHQNKQETNVSILESNLHEPKRGLKRALSLQKIIESNDDKQSEDENELEFSKKNIKNFTSCRLNKSKSDQLMIIKERTISQLYSEESKFSRNSSYRNNAGTMLTQGNSQSPEISFKLVKPVDIQQQQQDTQLNSLDAQQVMLNQFNKIKSKNFQKKSVTFHIDASEPKPTQKNHNLTESPKKQSILPETLTIKELKVKQDAEAVNQIKNFNSKDLLDPNQRARGTVDPAVKVCIEKSALKRSDTVKQVHDNSILKIQKKASMIQLKRRKSVMPPNSQIKLLNSLTDINDSPDQDKKKKRRQSLKPPDLKYVVEEKLKEISGNDLASRFKRALLSKVSGAVEEKQVNIDDDDDEKVLANIKKLRNSYFVTDANKQEQKTQINYNTQNKNLSDKDITTPHQEFLDADWSKRRTEPHSASIPLQRKGSDYNLLHDLRGVSKDQITSSQNEIWKECIPQGSLDSIRSHVEKEDRHLQFLESNFSRLEKMIGDVSLGMTSLSNEVFKIKQQIDDGSQSKVKN